MSETQVSIKNYVTDAYKRYGRSVNIDRHLPHLCDGLKPSSQRLILSALEYKDNIKTATVIGNTVGKYHPHSIDSLKDTVTNLVKWGIFEGQGNFGMSLMTGDSCEAANPRYTELRVKPEIREQLGKFMHMVPTTYSEMGYQMPTYIPTPIPFALVAGDQGISIGINQRIPAFKAQSLLDAYRADDPMKLESQYGLILDKNKSTLKNLWETGNGRLFLSMKTTRDNDGITIEGDTTLFCPNLSYMFDEFRWGNVNYQDLTTDIGKLRFYRAPKIRKITTEEIQVFVENAAKWDQTYYIRVHDDEKGFPISMRGWIDYCYKNYSNLALKGVAQEIKELENKIIFFNNLNDVSNELINSKKTSKEDLAKKFNIDISIVNKIASKSADYVRTTDVGKEVNKCETKIKELKANKVSKLIDSYVGALK